METTAPCARRVLIGEICEKGVAYDRNSYQTEKLDPRSQGPTEKSSFTSFLAGGFGEPPKLVGWLVGTK